MAQFRFQIPDELIKKLQDKIGGNVEVTDIARDALTLFNWAVDERAKGRLILSSDEKGDNMIRLTMSSLEAVGNPNCQAGSIIMNQRHGQY
jgi:hypothetical protein